MEPACKKIKLSESSEVQSNQIVNFNKDTRIYELDDNCLRQIFSHLPPRDKLRIERVCKRWQNLLKMKWGDVTTLDLNLGSLLTTLSKKLRKKRMLNVYFDALGKILKLCGNWITCVKFSNKQQFDNVTKTFYLRIKADKRLLKLLFSSCPNLTSLDLSEIFIKEEGILYLKTVCSKITKLSLGRWNFVSAKKAFPDLLSEMKNLQSVEIPQKGFRRLNTISDNLLTPFSVLQIKDLRKVEFINKTEMHYTTLMVQVENFQNITHVAVRCHQKVKKCGLSYTTSVPHLKFLNIDSLDNIESKDKGTLSVNNVKSNLKCKNCNNLTVHNIIFVLQTWDKDPIFQFIEIASCSNVEVKALVLEERE